jgi:hypothetical protein
VIDEEKTYNRKLDNIDNVLIDNWTNIEIKRENDEHYHVAWNGTNKLI